MMTAFVNVLQVLLLLVFAPALQGVIKKCKSWLQGRTGPSVWQPYRDAWKYLHKDEIVSEHASPIFLITPYIVFAATATAVTLVPVFLDSSLLASTSTLLLAVYLLGLARFFTALSGIDTGSSFGAMASSRDMFVSLPAEPALFLTLLALVLSDHTLNIVTVTAHTILHPGILLSPVFYLVLLAFFLVLLTETGRLPVDNPDTHLELTMIHEGMLLEYSGKRLALMMWSAELKQIFLYTLFIDLCVPWGMADDRATLLRLLLGVVLFFIKLLFIGLVVAFVEMSYAKIRLFRVPRLLAAAMTLSLIAIVAQYLL
ncbi:MAG: NADH-quinone oxidoreductase subunit H [Alicyclobacillaceae bacterium]|nr:NADH-quinone oxidoreductase subunit H [Alicyclobacillaceae bacterium]